MAAIPQAEVLCAVDLVDRALTASSLEKLKALGLVVIISGKIRDEKLLPGRAAV